jgi:hypothetical protein
MSSENNIISSKELLIETFEIAEINFLQSFKGINPGIVSKQFKQDVNHLAWIIGHCISHMDSYLSLFNRERKLSDNQRNYHAFGVSKDEITKFPFSFRELIDVYLIISEDFLKAIKELPEGNYSEFIHPENGENLKHMLQRITLHYMGHTGQIVLLRRMFNDPYWSFVGGIDENKRNKLRNEWIEWWEENKANFS